ncbi:MAG TPA: cytochrome c peroxidase [Gemmatimonadaceae bacterium]|nr:cytochrome c peroxidase [Gemmatimonadaceae bacterium]
MFIFALMRLRRRSRLALLAIVTSPLLLFSTTLHAVPETHASWSPKERTLLRSLSLGSLAPLAPDPSNRYADDSSAARLGQRLFFDTRLSSNGNVSCATCHVPEKNFQDGKPLGVGVATGGRRTMPVAGTAHSPWFFWDGRADSQWGQALGPLENPAEHGGDRVQYAHVIARNYRLEYERVFGRVPDMRGLPGRAGPVPDTSRARAWAHIAPARQEEISRMYANIGKAIAAYERKIELAPSRFDRFVEAELAGQPHSRENALSGDERAGLELFIGKANCVTCHNGALFTDNHFHNTGVPQARLGVQDDSGRATGVRSVMASEFNCMSTYSDAKPDQCDELRFAATEGAELIRAFKTPSLRNVALRAPFMHSGQIASLGEVLAHYDRAPAAPAGRSELKPLHLSSRELRQLEAFLLTLTGQP